MDTQPKRKYVFRDVDRHGNVRWYFKRSGQLKRRLPGGPSNPHFEKAYQAALRGEEGKPTARRAAKFVTKQRVGYLYFLRVGNHIKIGHSQRPLHRLDNLNTGLPEKVMSFVFISGSAADERALHKAFAGQRSSGEWFRTGPQLRRLMAHAAAYGCLPSANAGVVEENENEESPLENGLNPHRP